MKKLTKKSLEELAQVMPVLSEMEMRECIGGDMIILNREGQILSTGDTEMYRGVIPDYDIKMNDEKNTHWVVISPSGDFVGSCSSMGSLKRNGSEYDSGVANINNLDLEGSAINKDVLKFLGNNTDVEWMMLENESGNYSRLMTDNKENGVSVDGGMLSGYTTVYHTHPDIDGKDPLPSQVDRNSISDFQAGGIQKCVVYSAKDKKWYVYYGEAGNGEVQYNF